MEQTEGLQLEIEQHSESEIHCITHVAVLGSQTFLKVILKRHDVL